MGELVMETAIVITLVASLVMMVVFLGWYALTAPWERSITGRHIVLSTVVMSFLLLLLITEFIWIGMPYREPARLVVALMVLVSSVERVGLLIAVRRVNRVTREEVR